MNAVAANARKVGSRKTDCQPSRMAATGGVRVRSGCGGRSVARTEASATIDAMNERPSVAIAAGAPTIEINAPASAGPRTLAAAPELARALLAAVSVDVGTSVGR